MLAIKRAPRKWKDIKFQDHIVDSLIGKGSGEVNFPNVVLLIGNAGYGKTSIAQVLGAAILCENQEGEDPCGTCESCQQVFAGKSDPSIPSKINYLSGTLESGVDFYRRYLSGLEQGDLLPGDSKRVTIINEIQGLSPQAIDALLTPLEDPKNANLYFIFTTTKKFKLPQSMTSRALSFSVSQPPTLDLVMHLNKVIEAEKWDVPADWKVNGIMDLVECAEGCVRECLNTMESIVESKDFSSEGLYKRFPTKITADHYSVIRGLLDKEKHRTAITDLEGLIQDSSAKVVFGTIFREVSKLYRMAVLKYPLASAYQEEILSKKFPRMSASRVEVLYQALYTVSEVSGYETDLNILIYQLLTLTYLK